MVQLKFEHVFVTEKFAKATDFVAEVYISNFFSSSASDTSKSRNKHQFAGNITNKPNLF